MKKNLFLILVGLCFVGHISKVKAQQSWSQVGTTPIGAAILDLTSDNTGKVYALTYPKGEVYYTSDDGLSWNVIQGINPTMGVEDIEVDKISGRLFLSCTGSGGLYWTSDLGATWAYEYFTTNPITGYHSAISKAVQKAGTNIILCATNGGITSSVNRTTNLGASWSTYTVAFGINAFSKFSSNGSVFVAAHNGIYRSANNGLTWVTSSNGISGFDVSCVIEKSTVNKLFAGTRFNTVTNDTTGCGVFISTDGGITWNNSSAGMADKRVTSLEVATNGDVYATCLTSVYRSANNGLTWTAANNGLNACQDYTAVVSNSNGVFVSSAQFGVSFSSNAIPNWSYRNSGLFLSSTSSFCLGNNGSIFVIDGAYTGVHKWSNSSWISQSSGLPTSAGNQVIRTSNGDMYAAFLGTTNVLYKSINQGQTWSPVTSLTIQPGAYWAESGSIKEDANGNLYVIVAYSPGNGFPPEIHRSADQGLTWTKIYTLNYLNSSSLNNFTFDSDSTLYFSTSDPYTFDHVIKYTKGWGTVMDTLHPPVVPNPSTYLHLVVAPNDSLYILDETEIYKRNGSSWQQLTNGGWGTSSSNIGRINLYIDKTGVLYVTCLNCGVYKSTNDGVTWTNISNGIPTYTPPYNVPSLINFTEIQFDVNNIPYAKSFDGGAGNLMGIYKYSVITTNTLTTSSGEENFSSETLQVYPNPCQDNLLVVYSAKNVSKINIEVYNSQGNLIDVKENIVLTNGTNKIEMDVRNYSSGIYFVIVRDQLNTRKAKIIKE